MPLFTVQASELVKRWLEESFPHVFHMHLTDDGYYSKHPSCSMSRRGTVQESLLTDGEHRARSYGALHAARSGFIDTCAGSCEHAQ